MSFLDQLQAWYYQNRMVVCIVGVIIMILVALLMFFQHPSANESEDEKQSLVETPSQQSTSTLHQRAADKQQPFPIIVDIKGAVKRPNTYKMMSDDRVKQLLDRAIPLPSADLSQINLAEKLIDQKMIRIPAKGEQNSINATVTTATSPSSTNTTTEPINLNIAQLSDLTTVPGIGPAKAAAILTYRDEKGQFQSVEELKEVKGIGDKTYENLKSYFTV
ncbi:ComEA family DNA-binding protein [Staphylococcus sp. 17KM0847]|uniref:ComEA family DNA-binding protein n=1 Tax=Staphylococcus sp. 17KM0847 TaxID=2583989 RepID=UPI0015DC7145|nr:ComEA family DNA-binding protein [Staphylococcus sp. 17KM0847]QLK86031.1 ComEA family DNA-binding protein [Staphylococcus sp. 17KM0847]